MANAPAAEYPVEPETITVGGDEPQGFWTYTPPGFSTYTPPPAYAAPEAARWRIFISAFDATSRGHLTSRALHRNIE